MTDPITIVRERDRAVHEARAIYNRTPHYWSANALQKAMADRDRAIQDLRDHFKVFDHKTGTKLMTDLEKAVAALQEVVRRAKQFGLPPYHSHLFSVCSVAVEALQALHREVPQVPEIVQPEDTPVDLVAHGLFDYDNDPIEPSYA